MTPPPGASTKSGEPVNPERPDESDLALILASKAWPDLGPAHGADPNHQTTADDAAAAGWHWLAGSWAERLRAGSRDVPLAALDSAAARERLRRMHEASIRVDLSRVHSSWCVRALKEESPAVRRIVAASAAEPLRSALLAGLSLGEGDLAGDRAANPDARSWALALWTERLLGGNPDRTGDPPAIAILTRIAPRRGHSICRLAGEIKALLGRRSLSPKHPSALRIARERSIQDSWAEVDPRFLDQVLRDLQSKALAKVPARHRAARLGALSLARLLVDCEPVRLRWALQHWPYPIAKILRSLMPSPAERPEFLVQGETRILKTAWDRLNLEGKLPLPWPEL